jgi:hypothetical protein
MTSSGGEACRTMTTRKASAARFSRLRNETETVMAFSELELKRIDRTVGGLCRGRSRPEFADRLRIVYEIEGHTVSVYEERPPWDDVGEWTRMGVARFRFIRTRGEWQLYWMRRDLRWHRYDTDGPANGLATLVAVVDADEHGAFFG